MAQPHAPIWNHIGNIREDLCTQRIDEMQSALPGCYYTNNFFRACESQDQYSNLMTEPGHFYKPYRNACQIDVESVLRNAELTNKGEIYNLYTRAIQQVPFKGAGQNSVNADLRELETQLIQGHTTQTGEKSCESTSGISQNRMMCLPSFGNPQRLANVIQPVSHRQGIPSRDLIRRIDYEKMCLNRENNNRINQR